MSTMQLFVLGPAFGLPSIDAPCVAAVALLQLTVPNDYEVLPTSDIRRPLPFLVDGTAQVSGFNSIVRHLTDKRILSEQLDPHQRADVVAIASFIEHSAQTLLDISLYVGFENYRLATRPAYSKILPWHANYTLPPQTRNAARHRTEHLGISSIDVDNVHEDMSNRPEGFDGVGKEQKFEAATQQRASLLLGGKETLRSLLQKPEHAAVFKLNALADNFFEPLQDILGAKQYLLDTEEPQAIDCLVVGFLSLMLYPKLPQDWLATTMRRKYKRLAAYTERLHRGLALSTNVDDVVALDKCQISAQVQELRQRRGMTLPWSPSPQSTTLETLQSLRVGLWSQIPLLGQPHRLDLWNSKWHPFFYRNLRMLVLTATASIGAISFLSVHTGLVQWPHGEAVQIFGRRRISDFGHLGAALAGMGVFGTQGDSG